MARSAKPRVARSRPPPDAEHDYELWLQQPDSAGRSHAYVTVHSRDTSSGSRSRFAVRLDLHGTYSSKAKAVPDAFEVADRFFRRKFAAHEFEVSETVRNYHITARARFRIDCHAWEPVLWIRSNRPPSKGAMQAFDGWDSPFLRNTFPTAEVAARFAFSYGERMVLGLIGGLQILRGAIHQAINPVSPQHLMRLRKPRNDKKMIPESIIIGAEQRAHAREPVPS